MSAVRSTGQIEANFDPSGVLCAKEFGTERNRDLGSGRAPYDTLAGGATTGVARTEARVAMGALSGIWSALGAVIGTVAKSVAMGRPDSNTPPTNTLSARAVAPESV